MADMATTLEQARVITAQVMPRAELATDVAYQDDTYWLVPAYLPAAELEPDQPVPCVRKDTGAVEWLLPHLPPVWDMAELELG